VACGTDCQLDVDRKAALLVEQKHATLQKRIEESQEVLAAVTTIGTAPGRFLMICPKRWQSRPRQNKRTRTGLVLVLGFDRQLAVLSALSAFQETDSEGMLHRPYAPSHGHAQIGPSWECRRQLEWSMHNIH